MIEIGPIEFEDIRMVETLLDLSFFIGKFPENFFHCHQFSGFFLYGKLNLSGRNEA